MALIKCPECKKKLSDQCNICPNCGYPINNYFEEKNVEGNSEVINSTIDNKIPFYKKIWLWVIIGVVVTTLTVTIIILFNRETEPRFDANGNPVFVEFTSEVYTNADDYLGYYINIKGKVFQVMGDNGNTKGIQIWIDPDTCEQNLMIYYNTDVEVKQGDYIMSSGYIDSVTKYQNAYGAELQVPLVYSLDLQKVTYIDVMAPTIDTITSENLKYEQMGYSISIDKVEFAELETRVYATITNNGKALLNVGDAVIVQDGKQFNSKDNYDADYEQLPNEIVKGVVCSGIIVFPTLSHTDFEMTFDLHSDDVDEELDKIVFTISKNGSFIQESMIKEEEETPNTNQSDKDDILHTEEKPNTENKYVTAVTVAQSRYSANDMLTPLELKNHLTQYGYSAEEINYAIENSGIDWKQSIRYYVYALKFEGETITLTRCNECSQSYYGHYDRCPVNEEHYSCGWRYFYGYSRAETISKLQEVEYKQSDIDVVMNEYEYGEFIDELGDYIVVE